MFLQVMHYFRGSIGRTDLTGGSREQLLRSIHEKLLPLPEETLVAPGHGPSTTIGKKWILTRFCMAFKSKTPLFPVINEKNKKPFSREKGFLGDVLLIMGGDKVKLH